MQDSSELQISLHDFKQLQKDPSIAPKMQSKLKYLEASILNQPIDTSLLSELPEFQRISLIQTSRKEQISLFINLVKCLTNKNNITYFSNLKASIKKEQTFAGWNTCRLTCDTHQLIVYKKKQDQKAMYRFSLEMLWVSKIYREYRKRFVFGIAYEGQKYQIGFEEEAICSKTHGQILSLIRERRGVREKLKGANSSSKSTVSQSSQLQFQKENGVFQYQFNEDDLIQCEQKDYLQGIQQKVSTLQLFDNSSFELVKNIQNGRILQNKKQKTYKVCLLLQKINLEGILLKFIEMPLWNSNVESFKIINRIRNNTFLAYLKLKKYNVLTYQRETNLILTYFHTCSCLTQQNSLKESEIKHYLLLESINSQQSPSFGAVKMNLQMTIEFSFVQDSPGTTFLILQSKINFNSYEYFSYDRQMNMQFFHDFSFFSNYCKQHLHSPDKDKGHTFDLNYCACQLKKRRKLSVQSEIFPSTIAQQSEVQQQREFKTAALDSLDVVEAIRKYNRNIKDDMLGNIIRHRHHEKYYLKSTFDLGIKKLKEGELAAKSQKDYLLQGGRWKFSDQSLVFQDEEILKSQKGIIKTILKQIGSNLMAGKSIMNMSLPVEIFDDKSMLEVIANTMAFFPHFMAEAVKTTNLVQQMKFVVLAFMFMNSCFPNVQKPFNPILGETFQGIIGGIPIFLQQTFHHPPISSIFIKTDDFEAYGNFDIHVDLGFNSAYSKISSFFTVKIPKTKTQYAIKFPDVEMSGISYGERVFRLAGKAFAFERTNQMYCQIATGKEKKKIYEYNTKLKSADLAGGIFKVTNTFAKRLMSGQSWKNFDGVKYDDVIEKYSQISGKWYGDVMFDNVAYKTLDNGPFPAILERPSTLLPSDPVFRLDILHRKWREWLKSNQQKEILQNLQRKDRRLRQNHKK